jgi:hypothetical protein
LKLNELDQINEYREIQRQVMIQDNIKTVANELTNKQLELKEKETEYLNIQREKNEALNRYKLIEEELQKANAVSNDRLMKCCYCNLLLISRILVHLNVVT